MSDYWHRDRPWERFPTGPWDGEPNSATSDLEAAEPEAGWVGAEGELPNGWRVVGQPVEFELVIFLASAGSLTRDPRQAARQLAGSIPGAVVCYPTEYEREETVTAEEWREDAFWAHERLHRQNDDAAREAGTFAFWNAYTPKVVLNIGHHGVDSERFLNTALDKVRVDVVGVIGDQSLTPSRIERNLPNRGFWNTAVLQHAVDPAKPADCERVAQTAKTAYRYCGDAHYETASLVQRQIMMTVERYEEGDSPALQSRDAFLRSLLKQSGLLGYSTCFHGDYLMGVRDGIIPLSDQIILEIPDLDPVNGKTLWPDEGPPWLRPPEIASVDPFAKLEGDDYKAVQAAANVQMTEFHRALRAGGITRSCVAGVGATDPTGADMLAELTAGYVRAGRPTHLGDPRFIVVASGVFGGPAGTAAAVRLSKEFPDSRVDLMVTASRLPSLMAGVDLRGVGAGLRVVAGEPLRDFSDYSRVGNRVDRQPALWVPPKPKRTARRIATETVRKVSRHLKN